MQLAIFILLGGMGVLICMVSDIKATVKRMEEIMAETQDELDAAISALEGDVATGATEIKDAIATLKAKITAGASPADLTAEVDRLKALHVSLLSAFADAQAETAASAPSDTSNPAS